jgi:Transposase, Mutator family
VDGLLGLPFRDASGQLVRLDGRVRSRRSADLYLALLYSIAGDVAHLYDVAFDWRRHQRLVGFSNGLTGVFRAHVLTGLGQRTHRVRHAQRRVVGLPDEEFEKMLLRAVDLWGEYVAPGDRRFAIEPEHQPGALRSLKQRGLVEAPLLAIGDGALGLWAALDEIFPTTRHQRCWNHRVLNVLDKLPKRFQPEVPQQAAGTR